jgi:hypothetical protein
MEQEKYKIEEHRFENKSSKFILKRKVLFWWEKVTIHPYCTDPYTFVKLPTGINVINRNQGELVGIELKTKKKK